MRDPQFLTSQTGRRIAYHLSAGQGPGVVFLGGLRSDMTGSKALYLADWAAQQGRAFLRFDYSGHGQSAGRFEDGAIGDWVADAQAALALTTGPQILVGSSMGGWIALLLARANPDRIAGLVAWPQRLILPKTACGPVLTKINEICFRQPEKLP